MTTKEASSSARTLRAENAAEISKEILYTLFKGAAGQGVSFRLWDGQTLFEEPGVILSIIGVI
jgi:hypothetical protein